jgi:hypothetical protein
MEKLGNNHEQVTSHDFLYCYSLEFGNYLANRRSERLPIGPEQRVARMYYILVPRSHLLVPVRCGEGRVATRFFARSTEGASTTAELYLPCQPAAPPGPAA